MMEDSLQDLNLDSQQDPQSLKQNLELQSLHSDLDQAQSPERGGNRYESEHETSDPEPPQDQLLGPNECQNPAAGQDFYGLDQHTFIEVPDQDLMQPEKDQDQQHGQDQDQDQDQDQGQDKDVDIVLTQTLDLPESQGHQGSNQDRHQDEDKNQDLTAANGKAALEPCGAMVPALVITEAEESRCQAGQAKPVETPAEPVQKPADLATHVTPTDPGLSSSSDGGEMTCSDLLSLRSDSLSLASEPTVSRTSEEDDSHSVATSSVMSLFHRVQLDPVEKLWLRSCAVGNVCVQRQLLVQEPGLIFKKDFVSTALHWAAKQGRQESVDLMLQSGADVNVRSGYTALHLASIHGHQHIVHTLIHTHNAKTSLRDYHGKMAVHYWTGCSDVFNRTDSQSGGRLLRGWRTQRYALPSLLLTRSRSQGQINLEFRTPPQSVSHDVLDLQL